MPQPDSFKEHLGGGLRFGPIVLGIDRSKPPREKKADPLEVGYSVSEKLSGWGFIAIESSIYDN